MKLQNQPSFQNVTYTRDIPRVPVTTLLPLGSKLTLLYTWPCDAEAGTLQIAFLHYQCLPEFQQ